MKYTNGFDIDLVLPCLQQRLGWMQPTLSGSPVINSTNLLSKSGRYFNDGSFHELLTVNNVKENQEDPQINDAGINALLITKQNSAIIRSLNQIFREQELLDQALMYTRSGMNDMPVVNTNLWVGWLINVANDPSISAQITFGTFYFDSNCTFNMYLFQDGIRTPIQTISVTVVAWQRTEVDFTNLVLSPKVGVRYYFVYNQAELGGAKAIREQVETVASTKCFEAYNFQASPTTDGSFFNHDQRSYPALPAGVNLEIISFRDHTQRILRKANLFDEVQGLQMAAMVIEMVNMSTRTNQTQRQSEQQSAQLDRELNQAFPTAEVPVNSGLKSRINSEFKRLKDTFFPPQQAMSTSMDTGNSDGLDSYEQNWRAQNIRVALNPGILIT